jgi:hypothetical protein
MAARVLLQEQRQLEVRSAGMQYKVRWSGNNRQHPLLKSKGGAYVLMLVSHGKVCKVTSWLFVECLVVLTHALSLLLFMSVGAVCA